jgi:hypothetical protein
MQTFMISAATHKETFLELDNKRLGKQRVEAFQIMKALHDPTYGWQNHPAVEMWRGSEQYLYNYTILCCQEWTRRGYNDNVADRLVAAFPQYSFKSWFPPSWITEELVSTHRGNLYLKNPTHYPMVWELDALDIPYNVCCKRCNYYWPSHMWRRAGTRL